VGNGLLSFDGIAIPSDCDLSEVDHVYLLESDPFEESEFPGVRRHNFIFKTDAWKPTAAFQENFIGQFDIIHIMLKLSTYLPLVPV
jgi:hypothetical protein